jgi:hypothetical protein
MIMALVSYSIIVYAAMEVQKFLKVLAPEMSSVSLLIKHLTNQIKCIYDVFGDTRY